MMTRLTIITALIALFGVSFSFLAQNAVKRPGSAFASVAGSDCGYRIGIVCPIERDPVTTRAKF